MAKIWDSIPPVTGKHRLRPTAHQRATRRALVQLAITGILLATLIGLAAAAPVALLDLALATVITGLPVAITLGISSGIHRGAARLAARR